MKLKYIKNKFFAVSWIAEYRSGFTANCGFVFCGSEERAKEMGYTAASKSCPDVPRKHIIVIVKEFELNQLEGRVEEVKSDE